MNVRKQGLTCQLRCEQLTGPQQQLNQHQHNSVTLQSSCCQMLHLWTQLLAKQFVFEEMTHSVLALAQIVHTLNHSPLVLKSGCQT